MKLFDFFKRTLQKHDDRKTKDQRIYKKENTGQRKLLCI